MKSISRQSGFTLTEIMIAAAIIALMATIGLPNFIQARNEARKDVCLKNLSMIDSAKEQLALETNLTDGDTIAATANLDPYIRGGYDGLDCPAQGDYTMNDVGVNPTCNSAAPGHVL